MTIEYSVAFEALKGLVSEFSPLGELSNEAQTRFSFIDRFLTDCLGWRRDHIRVEVYEDGERTDYECGDPRQLIIEAKRADKSFEFPPRGNKANSRMKIRSLMAFNDSTCSAVEQVLAYCQLRGVPLAAISNGHQLVLFLASRLDGISPLEGDALVFDTYESMIKGFSTIFECLSPEGVEEKRLSCMLSSGEIGTLPPKISSSCLDYFSYRYGSDFQENVKNAASLVIEDIGKTSEYEKEFLSQCYCESGPISQYSLLSKSLLSSRYAALFPSGETGSRVEPINPKNEKSRISDKVISEAIARRPIVFLGDVGVGKTSFIKNLILIDAAQEFNKALCIYFDLGSKGTLSKTVKDGLLEQVEIGLRAHGFNLLDANLLESVYVAELQDFDTGFWAQLKTSQPDVFITKRMEFISTKTENKPEHLRRCIAEIAKSKRYQFVIIIDNADQRSFDTQQDAFVMAHELSQNWEAMIFLALRPQTFHSSKRSGAISAYPPKVFTISPPKLEDAIEKRLAFALKIAEGTISPARLQNLTLHIESLAIILKTLISSLHENRELLEFVVNVSSGNVRVAIELITKFIGNPNVETDKIVKIASEGGRYVIPLHEFSKGGLLGDYAYYKEDASYAYNLFNVIYSDPKEHFIALIILGYLAWDGAIRKQADGFIGLNAIKEEIQEAGYTQDQILAHLKKLTRKKLIETSERRLLETDEEEKSTLPEAFRITPLGAYHLKKWGYDFSFIDAVLFDTPIFDKCIYAELVALANEIHLSNRHKRVLIFISYLDSIWKSVISRPYFDWMSAKLQGVDSIARVEKRLRDIGKLNVNG